MSSSRSRTFPNGPRDAPDPPLGSTTTSSESAKSARSSTGVSSAKLTPYSPTGNNVSANQFVSTFSMWFVYTAIVYNIIREHARATNDYTFVFYIIRTGLNSAFEHVRKKYTNLWDYIGSNKSLIDNFRKFSHDMVKYVIEMTYSEGNDVDQQSLHDMTNQMFDEMFLKKPAMAVKKPDTAVSKGMPTGQKRKKGTTGAEMLSQVFSVVGIIASCAFAIATASVAYSNSQQGSQDFFTSAIKNAQDISMDLPTAHEFNQSLPLIDFPLNTSSETRTRRTSARSRFLLRNPPSPDVASSVPEATSRDIKKFVMRQFDAIARSFVNFSSLASSSYHSARTTIVPKFTTTIYQSLSDKKEITRDIIGFTHQSLPDKWARVLKWLRDNEMNPTTGQIDGNYISKLRLMNNLMLNVPLDSTDPPEYSFISPQTPLTSLFFSVENSDFVINVDVNPKNPAIEGLFNDPAVSIDFYETFEEVPGFIPVTFNITNTKSGKTWRADQNVPVLVTDKRLQFFVIVYQVQMFSNMVLSQVSEHSPASEGRRLLTEIAHNICCKFSNNTQVADDLTKIFEQGLVSKQVLLDLESQNRVKWFSIIGGSLLPFLAILQGFVFRPESRKLTTLLALFGVLYIHYVLRDESFSQEKAYKKLANLFEILYDQLYASTIGSLIKVSVATLLMKTAANKIKAQAFLSNVVSVLSGIGSSLVPGLEIASIINILDPIISRITPPLAEFIKNVKNEISNKIGQQILDPVAIQTLGMTVTRQSIAGAIRESKVDIPFETFVIPLCAFAIFIWIKNEWFPNFDPVRIIINKFFEQNTQENPAPPLPPSEQNMSPGGRPEFTASRTSRSVRGRCDSRPPRTSSVRYRL
jgi:hypothetical protein